jgi:multidrug resistance efflux pump
MKRRLSSKYHTPVEDLESTTDCKLSSVNRVKNSVFARWSVVILFVLLFLLAIALLFIPWQQTSFGIGTVLPYHPNERLQSINTPVKGIISKWYVFEGSKVKKDDPIVTISDIDPQLMERLGSQREAAEIALKAAQAALETSQKNLDRQFQLAKKGLKSQRDYELARLEYNKFLTDVSSKSKELADIQVKASRQASQVVKSPRDGIIMRIYYSQGGTFVKDGSVLVTLAPDTKDRVVELYIDGNDLPLVSLGRDARLQFEGWPAIQFSGWPSVAVGTFGGKVINVDPSDNGKGEFRVLIRPSKYGTKWPSGHYLRQGVKVKGWILLDQVPLGYELWRLFNNFPPTVEQIENKDKGSFIYEIQKNLGKIGK